MQGTPVQHSHLKARPVLANTDFILIFIYKQAKSKWPQMAKANQVQGNATCWSPGNEVLLQWNQIILAVEC